MWTMDNTEGFEQTELDMINALVESIAADNDGIDLHNINDAINNAWQPGMGAEQLNAATRSHLGVA